jgi:lipoyl(octanoyl) transferase
MIDYLYLGRVEYGEGLRLQEQLAQLCAEGRIGNTLLLLEHEPVLTLGRNADRSNILATDELLAERGIRVHEISRGGDVTYHGPGQLVGYPIFNLRSLTTPRGNRMGPVDFVRGMEEALIRVCGLHGVRAGRIAGLTGVWCAAGGGVLEDSNGGDGAKKIAAIGIHVSRGITSHGFAFNLRTRLEDFQLIVPCGIRDHEVTSLEREAAEPAALPTLETLAHEAARQFGKVFEQQVLAVESMEALRQRAEEKKNFPAEDRPVERPEEIEQILGCCQPPSGKA